MGFRRQEGWRIEAAEIAAGIDMLVRQFELADQPHRFLDVERTAPAPDFEHFWPFTAFQSDPALWHGTEKRGRFLSRHAHREDGMKILAALATAWSLLWPALAQAEDFPTRSIRLIVPFPPGGPNDIIARLVGQRMSELTKQPVVIDNRAGQAGVLGTDAVAKANPDGYTIAIVSASSLVINPSLEKVAYDVARDLAPVTLVVTVPEMLVVADNVPARNMAELVALAKAQPGKLNFASAGVGGLPHLAGELFKQTAGIDIVHVPYRGAAPAINDLLGQQVQMTFLDLPVILPHIKAGTLHPIALGARARAPTAPDVPITAEVGMPDLLIENWYGMIAPSKTPPDIVATLNRITNEAMNDPGVKQKLADQGLTVAGNTPQQFRGFIEAETTKWAKVIKDAGVSLEK
jgi:tripartite-type tricarboxylate transporter receptor subunit TctC